MSEGTIYYWHVRAINAGGTSYANGAASTFWSFTTGVSLPGAFNKSAPGNGAAGQSTSPTLAWGASSGASSYEYCYDTGDNNACDATWISTGTNTSTGLSGLAIGTTYYWQVRAKNAGGETYANGGAWWSFTTIPPAPGAFDKISPANSATNVPLAASLTWGTSAGATSYEYCYDTINDGTCSPWLSAGANTSVGLTDLSTSTTYFWQVRAVNAGGTTPANTGTWWGFTTVPQAPGAFAKSSPANGATAQPTSLTLTWGTSTGASSYEYCYDTSGDNACSAWTNTGSTTSAVLNGLSENTTYYWHVKAINPSGTTYSNGSATAFWSFTTGYNPPGAFTKTSPANGATAQPTSLTLSWGASSGAASYEYCYDTSGDNACSAWTANGNSTSASLSGLSSATTYYWHVRAINAGGSTYAGGSATAFWSFTTASTAPPGAFSKTSPASGSMGITTSAVLSWGASSAATSYEFCVDKVDNSTCDTSWVSAGSNLSASPSGLLSGSVYYWQVRAVNTGGTTLADAGTWWSFTTVPTFSDVPYAHWAWSWIERLYRSGITTGCNTGLYCPENQVTRDQMAVFLVRATHGSTFIPPDPVGLFNDVPTSHWAARYIEQLYADGITTGCNPALMLYCPADSVTRAQMAAFLLRAKYGKDFKPDPATGIFSDVPTSHWAAAWIEKLYADGITTGCGGGKYCPEDKVTRAQMAAFLVRAFALP